MLCQDFEFGRIESFDAEEHSEALTPMWNVEFNQISPGAFHGELEFVRTPRLTFYRERWDRRLNVNGTSPAGHFMLGTTASPNFSWHGEELGPRNFAVKQSATAVDFSAKGSDHVVLLVGPEVLAAHLGSERAALLLARQTTIECSAELNARFLDQILRLTRRYSGGGSISPSETAAHEYELLDLLVPISTPSPGRSDRGGKPLRAKALTRAVELAQASKRPISLPQLCESVGASQRTLEYAFRQAFDVPPTRFLRWCRMNGVHRDLLDSEPLETTITETGLRWGFSELGRMAVEYRQLFGELPSATLARTRRGTKVRFPSGHRGIVAEIA